MQRRTGMALIGLMLLLLLAACGGADAPTAAPTSAPTTAADAAPTAEPTAPAPVEPTSAAPAEPTVAATAQPAAGETITVETRYGSVAVPAAPLRVVTLDEGALDAALAVGITPVGAISSRLSEGVAPYLAAQVSGIAIVGNPGETNFEAVINAAPDLILASSRVDEATYATLSAIAPTIVPANNLANWQDAALEYAAALGKTAEMQQVLADIEAATLKLRDELALAEGTSVALIRWMPQGPVVMSRMLPGVKLLESLGLTLPPLVTELPADTPHTDVLSLEQLSEVDTDWLFVATFNAEGDEALNTAREQSAFAALKASSTDQVIPVSAQLWSSAFGPLAAQAMLADVAASLE